MLQRLPLRLKLIATIAIPVALLLMVVIAIVADRSATVADRQAERDGVERATALLDVVTALQGERNVLLSPRATNADLEASRQNLDQALTAVLDPSFELEQTRSTQLVDLRDQVEALRETAGSDMDQFRQTLGSEIQEGRTREAGTNSQVILTLNPLTISAIEFVSFAPDTEPSTSAADDIRSTKLLTHLQEAVFQEISGYALLAQQQLPNNSAVAAYVNSQGAATELWENALIEFGSRADAGSFATILESSELALVTSTRNDLRALAPDAPVTFDAQSVMGETQGLVGQIEQLKIQILDRVSQRAEIEADDARGERLLVAAGTVALTLALVALLSALYRSIRRPLKELTRRSNNIAEVELPATVRRFRDEDITADDIEIDVMEADTNDEIGQLVGAFNAMHETAVQLASEQAGSRRIVGEMFVNLGRRNQKLLNRLLSSLDVLEREEEDPDVLEQLFRVDHLATRMRRNAESLLILAGAQSPRQWKRSITIEDVIRASLSEVEEFERVDVNVADSVKVVGTVVADLAHALAEVVENALSFSPPDSRVLIMARWSHRGYQLTVTDSGLGIDEKMLVSLNERIVNALTSDETPSRYLGLYVVGRLAGRHNFDVGLFEAPQGGTTARIVIDNASLDQVVDPRKTGDVDTGQTAHSADERVPAPAEPAAFMVPPALGGRPEPRPAPVQSLNAALQTAPDDLADIPQRQPGTRSRADKFQVSQPHPTSAEFQPPAPVSPTNPAIPTRNPGSSLAGLSSFPERLSPNSTLPSAAPPMDRDMRDPLHVAHVYDAFSSGTANAEHALEGVKHDD